ncbi:MAG: DUF502 domain-containing protein [Verrucomicrobiota bacterium]
MSPSEPAEKEPLSFKIIRQRLLAGIGFALPTVLTVWLLIVLYQQLLRFGNSIVEFAFRFFGSAFGTQWSPQEVLGPFWSWLLNLTLPLVLFGLLGFLLSRQIGQRIVEFFGHFLQRMPGLNWVYNTIKQVIDAIRGMGSKERQFKGVVYVEYPAPGCRLIGFVTNQYYDPDLGKNVTAAFLPTSPNPLTGFTLIMDNDHVIPCNMKVEEATKLILSAGIVSPSRFTQLPVDEAIAQTTRPATPEEPR